MTIVKLPEIRRILTAAAVLLIAGCDSGTGDVLEPAEKNTAAWPELESPVSHDPDIEAQIDQLLERMTLEQKVGQLIECQLCDQQVKDNVAG